MSDAFRICLIDDDAPARAGLERVLAAEGYDVSSHPDGQAGLKAALEEDFDCVLTDLRMPGVSGLELIDTLHEELPNLPVVLMTAHGTTETAIEATRRGAFDYLIKPFEMEELLPVLARASEAGRRGRAKVGLAGESKREVALVGQSRAMQAVYKEIGRVADKPVPVLLLGETGTGKELVVIPLPPLRERREDIPELVNYFVARHGAELGGVATVQPAALKFLGAQPWPGNVRQLENVVKRALLLAHGYPITEELIRATLVASSTSATAEAGGKRVAQLCQEALAAARRSPGPGAIVAVLGAVERELLAQAQADTAGNISQMAQLLGWSRLTVREKLKLHGLRPSGPGEAG